MITKAVPHPVLPAFVQNRVDTFHERRTRSRWGGRHILRGQRTPGAHSTVVDSNDYLCLSGDKRIADAVAQALETMRGSRLASGVLLYEAHPQTVLEQEMARRLDAAAGVLCQSGWDANLGLLQAVAGPETPVYVDLLGHMSLWAGAKAADAPLRPFRHNNTEHLRRRIEEHGPGVIAVDALYSVCGSLAPLPELCTIAEESGSVLIVDESHSLGTHGPAGAGLTVQAGLVERVHFRTASLSKAYAARAGFIAGADAQFMEYFKMTSQPAVFSSTLLPTDLAQISATLDVIRDDVWRRTRLREVSAAVRSELTDLGYDLRGSDSHIVSLQTGPDEHVIRIRDTLEEHDVFASVFCPPATPNNRTLLRLSLHCELDDQDVRRITNTCRTVRPLFEKHYPQGLTNRP
ncbi:alpha-hydroxyketone-type quorum-sensing autoinducer synthase [Streptomyces sp. NPDC029554]|uniref:alpha-hydroxyketone-type quorum-sensing autoinducer synthase n=1 Tax=Streptomyces sp. NPDC029554 TaxID=3155126 RepID=UPI0033D3089C